jgi:hypothetical protein
MHLGAVRWTGQFAGTSDFDPGTGIYNLTCTNNNNEVFICKLNAAGNFVWAKAFTSNGSAAGVSMAVDENMNVITIGDFDGTTDFNPGIGTYNIGSNDMFISKLDSSGNFIW